MFEGPASVLGGLPVWAEVYCSGEDDAEVEGLYWLKRDGSKGAPFSQKMWDRVQKHDPYWIANVIEQVFDHIEHEKHNPDEPPILLFGAKS